MNDAITLILELNIPFVAMISYLFVEQALQARKAPAYAAMQQAQSAMPKKAATPSLAITVNGLSNRAFTKVA